MDQEGQLNRQRLETLKSVRGPLIVWMILIGALALFVVNTLHNVIVTETSHIPVHPARPLAVIFEVTCILLSIWFSPWFYKKARWLVVGLPLFLTWAGVLILSDATPIILLGTFPVFMIYLITLYNRPKKTVGTIILVYLVSWAIYFRIAGWQQALMAIVVFLLLTRIVFYYWHFYENQLQERQRVEDLYNELKLAYSQVEESATHAERQRVARELHDTLTQGVAGVVMQLEAAQSFLGAGELKKTTAVLDESIKNARTTLRESRVTLTDLRQTTEESLPARIQLVNEAVQKSYGLNVAIHIDEVPDYSPTQLTEITRIVSEALTNVAKHAQTDQAVIRSEIHNRIFKLQIIDFGRGFDVRKIKARSSQGHYGLQGLQERAEQLGGVVTLVSSVDEGTTVSLTIPIERRD